MASVGMNFSNHGSGSQPVFVGDGTQNVHAGVGDQYNADNINFCKRPWVWLLNGELHG